MQVQEQVINGFRLSPQQKRLWSLQQDSLVYGVQSAILLEGNLKTDILKSALQTLINRQEILRTKFQRPPGIKTPVQVICEQSLFDWQEIDLTNYEQQLNKVDFLLQESICEQRDILHVSLLKLSCDSHILLLSLPALCADSWSIKILVQELSQCYDACLQDKEISDEEVVQYLQFSEWQNELLEDADAEIGKQYWDKYDLSTLATLTLPFENKLSAGLLEFAINSSEWKIESSLLTKIKAISQKYQVSIDKFLLTCWQVLLWRFTGESNITVGIAADGRKYEELETVIGLLAKYVPLTSHLAEDFSFAEVLQDVNQAMQDAFEWQEYFIWEKSSESDSHFFPVSFDFQQNSAIYSAGEISFSIYQQFACIDRYKLKLSCIQQKDDLIAKFEYDANLFNAEDIQRLAEHFQSLVESVVANPETAISKLEILSDRHLQQLLIEFNNTQVDFSQNMCFHQLFEEQVASTPNSIAVVFEDQKLTYAELNARANQLAHYLQKLGVKPEVLVGICVERSLKVIVAILGILKAGGAYLPLDPALPAGNLCLRLVDAQAPFLLTQQQFIQAQSFASLDEHTIQVICLERDGEAIATETQQNPHCAVITKNLAYVIYTSGSTGKPKGVAIEHRQLCNYLNGILHQLNLPTGASFATVSTIAADLGNTAIFPALSTGGCLHIITKERTTDPTALADYFSHHQIDCLKIVPSHLEALLTSANAKSILPRQKLILGGESASWKLIERIQQLAPECTIINHYGPTEATVGILTYQVDWADGDNHQSATVPLGRPIPNTQIYLLDKHLQPVPIGVKGELYIGGASVARGYLNRPELTLEKFISNPFSHLENALFSKGSQLLAYFPKAAACGGSPRCADCRPVVRTGVGWGDRLYKTGDLARYLPNGNIEFLGRTDNQVKVRGYRIELEEIATVLSQHPDVSQSVVIQREDVSGDKRLVAYVVSTLETLHTASLQNLKHSELRNFLKEKLPEYMLPSAFVMLKSLPLTPNGKVDRQALPAPDQNRSDLAANFVAPRNPIEESLAQIWIKLLGVEKIGIHDNFFDLGGHSLLITQLFAKVREAFQVEVSIKRLFEAPTVARLAECIEKATNAIASDPTIDLNAQAVLDPDIRPQTLTPQFPTTVTAIFLTGATGFLGAFLLHQLLQKTQADIYCLVRAANTEDGKKRIQSALENYFLWNESINSRIIPVVGDLSQPLLGLADEQWRSLANQIDVIYHNGALVNFTYPYSALKAPNVLGTQEVLRLACEIKVKPVHFISTIGVVFSANNSHQQIVKEDDSINAEDLSSSGYTQSKWVAEKLVTIAQKRGLPISIYRPGRVSGHSQTGVCNPNDHTFRMIKGCIQLGMAPARNTMVNIIPVDYAVQTIVYLSQQQESLGKAFHLVNPKPVPWNNIIKWISSFGYPIKQIPDNQWRTELRNLAEQSQANALYPLLSVVAEKISEDASSNSAILQIDCQNTLAGIANTSLACPHFNADLLRTYISYLVERGFLNAPD
ncbi:amino acid adenylation domain-containing protein [Cylindrospermum sp. NIES-4074]|nr:amino acid adenylation domain-containing protein [Cylindrospermum sp. NIES-4074]